MTEFCFRTKPIKDKLPCEEIFVSADVPSPNDPCPTCKRPMIQGSQHVLDMIKNGAHLKIGTGSKFEAIPAERKT